MAEKASEVVKRAVAAGQPPEPAAPEADEEELELLEDLRRLGIDIAGVHQVRASAGRADVRELLFTHLGRDYSEYMRSRMAGAIGGPKIRDEQFERLVRMYRVEQSDWVRQQFADSVARSAGGRLDAVVPLIRDRSLGGSRVLLVKAFRRSKRPEAQEVLEELRDDPGLTAEIRRRLGPV